MYIESHPRRFVSPSPRHLCGRCLPRPGRGVSVYPARPERGRRDRSFSFVFPNLQLSTFDFQPSPSSNSFPCHTSENSPVSPTIATDPKSLLRKSFACHTSETPRGALAPPPVGRSRVLPTYPLYFHILVHSIALAENSTLLFSSNSQLFLQEHPVGGRGYTWFF